MKRIFVTATNTDIGKTFISKIIIKELQSMGYRALGCKPIETGVSDIPKDAKELLDCSKESGYFGDLELEDICFYRFKTPAAPYIAKEKEEIDIDFLKECINRLDSKCDILIIEGAGGLYVPISKEYYMIDLIKDLKSHALLVGHSALGCINDILLSSKALESRKIEHTASINLYKERALFGNISQKFLDEYFEELPILPRDSRDLCKKLLSII